MTQAIPAPTKILKSINMKFESTISQMMDKLQYETKLRYESEQKLALARKHCKDAENELFRLSNRINELEAMVEEKGSKLKKALYEKEEVRQNSRNIMSDMLSKMKDESETRKQCERELELLRMKLSLPQINKNKAVEDTEPDTELLKIKESQISKLREEVAALSKTNDQLRQDNDALTQRNTEMDICHKNLCRGFQAREDEIESRLADRNMLVNGLGKQKEHVREGLQQVAERLCELMVDLDDETNPMKFLAPPSHHQNNHPPVLYSLREGSRVEEDEEDGDLDEQENLPQNSRQQLSDPEDRLNRSDHNPQETENRINSSDSVNFTFSDSESSGTPLTSKDLEELGFLNEDGNMSDDSNEDSALKISPM